MIIGIPKNDKDFFEANPEQSKFLHKLGFVPIYRYNNNIYFLRTDELEKVVEKWKK